MKTFNASLVGYDSSEWSHVDKRIEIDAESLDEAKKLALKWCNDHSDARSFDWCVQSVREKE